MIAAPLLLTLAISSQVMERGPEPRCTDCLMVEAAGLRGRGDPRWFDAVAVRLFLTLELNGTTKSFEIPVRVADDGLFVVDFAPAAHGHVVDAHLVNGKPQGSGGSVPLCIIRNPGDCQTDVVTVAEGPQIDGASTEPVEPLVPDFDPRRALMVTDVEVLQGAVDLSLRRVLARLIRRSGDATSTADDVLGRIWDASVDGRAAADPSFTVVDDYVLVAAVNRFDLAPHNGSNCGEYRLIYASASAPLRSTIAIDAVLPTPDGACGLAACRGIQAEWAALSTEDAPQDRARRLSAMFFTGVAHFPAIIEPAHLGADAGAHPRTGHIRTNVERNEARWNMSSMTLELECAKDVCVVGVRPAPTEGSPEPTLFDPARTDPRARAFRGDLVSALPLWSRRDLRCFGTLSPGSNYDDLRSGAGYRDTLYLTQFVRTGVSSPFSATIEAAVTRPLTAEHVVARAEALSCKGCHQHANSTDLGDGLIWPDSLGFVHVGGRLERAPVGLRYAVSEAVTELFLPERERIMRRFLEQTVACGPVVIEPPSLECASLPGASDAPLSGRWPH